MDMLWGPPELIALDIDGTIVRHGHPVSPRVLAGIRKAAASGAHVVLATGRTVNGTWPIVAELGLTEGVVLCSNGAVRVDTATRELLDVQYFDARPLVDGLRTLLPGASFAVELPGVGNLVTGPFPVAGWIVRDEMVDHETLVASPVSRLTVWWEGHTAEDLAALLIAARFDHMAWQFDRTQPWLVAVSAGVSKGTALEKLRLDLGVAAEATLAVGDGDNDLEMLRWAAYSVAMGQAADDIRAAAREVTGTVEEDGLAAVLERWYR
jgi:hydroxymethylpyrimidine pyrophosphatase-like HAD family hydrolase